jgi:hypothetical protein
MRLGKARLSAVSNESNKSPGFRPKRTQAGSYETPSSDDALEWERVQGAENPQGPQASQRTPRDFHKFQTKETFVLLICVTDTPGSIPTNQREANGAMKPRGPQSRRRDHPGRSAVHYDQKTPPIVEPL